MTTPTPRAAAPGPMKNVFRSSRLLYRAIEPRDDPFMHQVQSDVEAYSNSSIGLLVPETEEASQKWREHLKDALIAVIICLPPSSDGKTNQQEQPQQQKPQTQDGEAAKSDAEKAATESTSTSKPTPTPIGVVSLTKIGANHRHHRHASISIDVIDGYRGVGYGAEAIRWILDWGFRVAGLHRISIEAFSWNEGANRLYAKIGFVLEGRQREQYWYDGGWHDQINYALLEHEWRELRVKWAEEDKAKEAK